jgi:hypothetical protein
MPPSGWSENGFTRSRVCKVLFSVPQSRCASSVLLRCAAILDLTSRRRPRRKTAKNYRPGKEAGFRRYGASSLGVSKDLPSLQCSVDGIW